jgi:hypothetical protein
MFEQRLADFSTSEGKAHTYGGLFAFSNPIAKATEWGVAYGPEPNEFGCYKTEWWVASLSQLLLLLLQGPRSQYSLCQASKLVEGHIILGGEDQETQVFWVSAVQS